MQQVMSEYRVRAFGHAEQYTGDGCRAVWENYSVYCVFVITFVQYIRDWYHV